jgi:hypothetical protein
MNAVHAAAHNRFMVKLVHTEDVSSLQMVAKIHKRRLVSAFKGRCSKRGQGFFSAHSLCIV